MNDLVEKHQKLITNMAMGACYRRWDNCPECKKCLVANECKECTLNSKNNNISVEELKDEVDEDIVLEENNEDVVEKKSKNIMDNFFSYMNEEFNYISCVEKNKCSKYEYMRNNIVLDVLVSNSNKMQFRIGNNVIYTISELNEGNFDYVIEKLMVATDVN